MISPFGNCSSTSGSWPDRTILLNDLKHFGSGHYWETGMAHRSWTACWKPEVGTTGKTQNRTSHGQLPLWDQA